MSFNTMTKELKKYIKHLAGTTAASERIESELKIAHDIQMGILPKEFPAYRGEYEVDIYALIEPAKQVGGDLYDFFFLNEDQLCFAIGDASGKGVPAAVFMTAVKTLIKATAKTIDKPSVILRIVNEEISKGNDYATFVTVFLGLLNVRTGVISYIEALTITASEFNRRFLLYSLPKGFVRIRYDRFLANRYRSKNLTAFRNLIGLADPPVPYVSP